MGVGTVCSKAHSSRSGVFTLLFFICSDDSLFVYDCISEEKTTLGNKG